MNNQNQTMEQKQELTQLNEQFAAEVADVAEAGYKKVEEGTVSGYQKIENGVVSGYKKIENGVVTGYKKIENGVVEGFGKVVDKCVEVLFAKEGETVEEAKARLTRQDKEEENHAE